MGRDHNLPGIFGRIHENMHTPHYAVAISAVLVIVMALLLPIDEVAKAADVMFLFMFAQVNITLMTLRQRRPDLDRGYLVPFFPWPAVIGVVTNMALAIFLANVALVFANTKNESNEDTDKGINDDEKEIKELLQKV